MLLARRFFVGWKVLMPPEEATSALWIEVQ